MRTHTRIIASLALLGALVAFVVISTRQDIPSSQSGWCCLRAGNTCRAGYDPFLCRDSGGQVYSADLDSCTFACHSLVDVVTSDQ